MAEIRCPKCGKNNSDILDTCQFCQTALKPDSVLRIGQAPTRKDTGELESVLPDWLKDVRQQARSSAEEDAAQEAALPKAPKEEPPDLLAGLVSQTGEADEEEIPDWLASINPDARAKPAAAAPPEAESDFFAQFHRSEAKPTGEPVPEESLSVQQPVADQAPDSEQGDDLSKWFARASEGPEEVVQFDPESGRIEEAPWRGGFEAGPPPGGETAPQEEEDLSWLHNLEDASKQTGDLQTPTPNLDWMANFESPAPAAGSSGAQEDLSWLDSLGGIEEAPQMTPGGPAATRDEPSWLDHASAPPSPPFESPPEKPASPSPFGTGEDLSWLANLGETPEPSQPREQASAQEDLSWLNSLGAEPGSQATPPFTEPEAPGEQAALFGQQEELEPPDWLKSAMQTPSMPAPGDVSMDWFASQEEPPEEKQASETPQPPPVSDPFAVPGEPSPAAAASADVDSLFSVEMPDWLARAEPTAEEPARLQAEPAPPPGEESLAPVDLPSWVQAMRPVEAVLSETAAGVEEEPEEKQGPLAGLRGVIPGAAIGSSMRPKPVSLKLQATNEQQAGAALLEKILTSESSPRPLITSAFIWSQKWLRLALTGLFLLVLGLVIGLRSQSMQIYAALPAAGDAASNAIASLPAGARVLVLVDYEPSLAGEMEAVAGPLLDQMILLHNPELSFVSTSPNGAALVERLVSNTGIQQLSAVYRNLGFLPGGPAGALGFIQAPGRIIPASEVQAFSDYAMVVLVTDHAESGRVWIEQLGTQRVVNPALANQPLIVIASAQAGPLLQPYVGSHQITGMVSGLPEGARYEYKNGTRPGIARSYWDAFGIGLVMAVALIVFGSLWSLFAGIRARRAEAEQG